MDFLYNTKESFISSATFYFLVPHFFSFFAFVNTQGNINAHRRDIGKDGLKVDAHCSFCSNAGNTCFTNETLTALFIGAIMASIALTATLGLGLWYYWTCRAKNNKKSLAIVAKSLNLPSFLSYSNQQFVSDEPAMIENSQGVSTISGHHDGPSTEMALGNTKNAGKNDQTAVPMDFTNPAVETLRIPVSGKQLSDPAFSICGNANEGIFIKNSLENNLLQTGDQINFLKIIFENMPLENATVILKLASMCRLEFEVSRLSAKPCQNSCSQVGDTTNVFNNVEIILHQEETTSSQRPRIGLLTNQERNNKILVTAEINSANASAGQSLPSTPTRTHPKRKPPSIPLDYSVPMIRAIAESVKDNETIDGLSEASPVLIELEKTVDNTDISDDDVKPPPACIHDDLSWFCDTGTIEPVQIMESGIEHDQYAAPSPIFNQLLDIDTIFNEISNEQLHDSSGPNHKLPNNQMQTTGPIIICLNKDDSNSLIENDSGFHSYLSTFKNDSTNWQHPIFDVTDQIVCSNSSISDSNSSSRRNSISPPDRISPTNMIHLRKISDKAQISPLMSMVRPNVDSLLSRSRSEELLPIFMENYTAKAYGNAYSLSDDLNVACRQEAIQMTTAGQNCSLDTIVHGVIDDECMIGKENMEKLLYFQNQLARQQEELAQLGIAIPMPAVPNLARPNFV